MGDTKENNLCVRKVLQLIGSVYQNKRDTFYEICSHTASWKINSVRIMANNFEQLRKIMVQQVPYENANRYEFHDMRILKVSDGTMQISGFYKVICDNRNLECNDILFTFHKDHVIYVQINSRADDKKVHRIKTVNEDVYSLKENEILYIEAHHNQVIWHRMSDTITSNDSLQHLETVLSKDFVRIQRGYLVNKNNVRCIRRCEAVMSNGDILVIPCKKYVRVKALLITE